MAKQEGWRKQGTQQGGRILVVRQRGRQGIWRNEGSAGVFTIFVNNIPNSVIPKGFYNLFTKFGVLKDVFMPQKKIRVINTRFGFVRFDCCVAAKIVVEKANGLWVDDKAIEVGVQRLSKAVEGDAKVGVACRDRNTAAEVDRDTVVADRVVHGGDVAVEAEEEETSNRDDDDVTAAMGRINLVAEAAAVADHQDPVAVDVGVF
ncbi:uncharacterized protein LOC114266695 [Camellia sinensis]|uniref:uncharacterized protein LOC114266695 n=1 Tax=Camellia sinensis TaxID=4442 RepID=UPI001035D405|nr:uncharacterized protein LOC114266695 [Camellia sinensis]